MDYGIVAILLIDLRLVSTYIPYNNSANLRYSLSHQKSTWNRTKEKRVTVDSSLSALMCPRCNLLLASLSATLLQSKFLFSTLGLINFSSFFVFIYHYFNSIFVRSNVFLL
uniref:Secreted protein n=1 Tax=Heterorhabditis bacteriophora TaxID=37862 RepID=A0A1I7WHM9_HETBA